MKRFTWLFLICLVGLLSSCGRSIFDEEARCPFIDRGGCQSIERVNQMVTKRCFTPDGLYVQQACVEGEN